jgi:hypothetical protein
MVLTLHPVCVCLLVCRVAKAAYKPQVALSLVTCVGRSSRGKRMYPEVCICVCMRVCARLCVCDACGIAGRFGIVWVCVCVCVSVYVYVCA